MYKDECFYTGEAFHEVAQNIIPDTWLDDESDDDGRWFVPSVVNMAFACELYLKSLLSSGDDEIRGHYLYDLYKMLSGDKKSAIINSVHFKGDDDFEKELNESSRLFEDWRYFFEKGMHCSVDVIFLENLAITLHDIAAQGI